MEKRNFHCSSKASSNPGGNPEVATVFLAPSRGSVPSISSTSYAQKSATHSGNAGEFPWRGTQEREALKHHLIRFEQMLERTTTMTSQEKHLVMEELLVQREYDFFIDENRHVKQRVARARKEALAIGEAKGEAKGKQNSVLVIVQARFPTLEVLARKKILQIDRIEMLDTLIKEMSLAANEESARHLLDKLNP
jgi:hypothetical protein